MKLNKSTACVNKRIMRMIFYAFIMFQYCNGNVYAFQTKINNKESVNQVIYTIDNTVPISVINNSDVDESSYAYGKMFSSEINDIVRNYVNPIYSDKSLIQNRAKIEDRSRILWAQVDKKYRDELEGIHKGSGVPLEELILANTLVDNIKKSLNSCTVFIGKVQNCYKTNGNIFARNLDYRGLNILEGYTLITVYKNKDEKGAQTKRAFASIGWPGFIGVLTGINQDGLSVAVNEVYTGNTFNSIPYSINIRQVLEEAKDLGEAKKIIDKQQYGTRIILSVSDRENSAVYDIDPDNGVSVRDDNGGFNYATNLTYSEYSYYKTFNNNDNKVLFRERIIEKAIKKGIVCDDFEKIITDTRIPNMNIHSMIILPEFRQIKIRIGEFSDFKNLFIAKYF